MERERGGPHCFHMKPIFHFFYLTGLSHLISRLDLQMSFLYGLAVGLFRGLPGSSPTYIGVGGVVCLLVQAEFPRERLLVLGPHAFAKTGPKA